MLFCAFLSLSFLHAQNCNKILSQSVAYFCFILFQFISLWIIAFHYRKHFGISFSMVAALFIWHECSPDGFKSAATVDKLKSSATPFVANRISFTIITWNASKSISHEESRCYECACSSKVVSMIHVQRSKFSCAKK